MFHPADENIRPPRQRWANSHFANEQDYYGEEWVGTPLPVDPRFGQAIVRGTVAVATFKKDGYGSKRVGAASKAATREMERVAEIKAGKPLLAELREFLAMSPGERDELREGKDGLSDL